MKKKVRSIIIAALLCATLMVGAFFITGTVAKYIQRVSVGASSLTVNRNRTVTVANGIGGTVIVDPVETYKGQSIALGVVTDPGYTYIGTTISYKDPAGKEQLIKLDASARIFEMPDADVTVTPDWEENKLTVNYHSNNATSAFQEALNPVGEGKNVLVYTYDFNYSVGYPNGLHDYHQGDNSVSMARTGHTATGKWGTTQSGGTLVSQNTAFASGQALAEALGLSLENGNATINLYAQWNANTYTVTLDIQNGSGGTSTLYELYANKFYTNATSQTGVTVITPPTRDGYTFGGYYSGTNGSGTQVIDSTGKILVSPTYFTANKTAYAKWEPNTNTKYVVNHWQQNLGASATTYNSTNYTLYEAENLKGTTAASLNLDSLKKQHTGFTYALGRVSDVTATTTTILGDGTRVIDLYYTRNSYQFVLGSATGVITAGSTQSGTYQYGATIALKAVSQTGYQWGQWTSSNTSLVGSTTTANTTFVMPAGNLTMTPSATAYSLLATYDKLYKTLKTGQVDSSTWTQANDEFIMTASGGSGGYISGLNSLMTDGEKYRITIQAKASGDKNIRLNFEGGPGCTKNISLSTEYQKFYVDFTYDVSTTYKALTFYSSNWVSGDKLYIRDITVSKIVTFGTEYNALYTPVKTGYAFGGWYDAATGGSKITSDTTVAKPDDHTLYARWMPNTYSVKYDANGGSGSLANSSHIYDVAKALSANSYIRTGYTFDGWNSKADGSGTAYTDKASVKNLSAIDGEVITLYAQWKASENTKYTVQHWHQNVGGTASSRDDVNYTLADTENLIGTSGVQVTPGVKSYTGFTAPATTQTVTIAGDGSTIVNYYYTRDSYKFTLGSATGIKTAGSTQSGTYQHGATITLKSINLPGYDWGGWTSNNSSVASTAAASWSFQMPTGDVTMTPSASIRTYSIGYTTNGGTNPVGAPTKYTVATGSIALGKPSRPGYVFTGWTEETTTNKWASGFIDINTGVLTTSTTYPNSVYSEQLLLKAGVTYTITGSNLGGIRWRFYDVDGNYVGSTTGDTFTPSVRGYVRILLYEGCSVANRNAAVISSNQKAASMTVPTGSTGNKTFAANWSALPNYVIVYNLNGGSVASANPEYYNVNTETFELNNPTKVGYTFTGWTESLSTINWYDGFLNLNTGGIETSTQYPNSVYSEMLYLKAGVKYTISGTGLGDMRWRAYRLDGSYIGNTSGTSITPSQTCYVRVLPYQGATATNRNAAVISSNEKSVNVSVVKGSTGNRTFTANWTPNSDTPYTVKHWLQNLGADDTQNSTNYKLQATENKTGTTASNVTPTVKSYTGFTAPSTKSVTIAADGSTVVNYYYTRNSYTVTLAKGTGISAVAGGGTYEYGTTVSIDATAATGYSWNSWTRTIGGEAVSTTKAYRFTMPAANVSYTAKGLAMQYTINYLANGGSGSMTSETVTYDTKVTIKSNSYSRTGYTFVGWTVNSNGVADNNGWTGWSGTWKYVNGQYGIKDGELNLYAVWKPNSDTAYTVKHWLQNLGADDTQNSTNYKLQATENKSGTTASNVTPTVKSYTGFTAPSTKSVTIAADGSTVVNYYYTRNSYTVTLAKGTGISAVAGGGTYEYGTTVSIDATAATGYSWNSWTQTTGGEAVSTTKAYRFTMPAANVSYTAKGLAMQYTINYLANGGSGSMTSETVTYDTKVTIKSNSYSRTGYTFVGWTVNSNGVADNNGWTGWSGTWKYVNGQYGIKDGELNLYAVWVPNTYTITLDNASGTGGNSALYEVYGSKFYTDNANNAAITSVSIPSKTNYGFCGYYTSPGGVGTQVIDNNGKILVETTYFDANQTLYAKWQYGVKAFAVYSASDKSLTFYKNADTVLVGEDYRGKVATAVYYGIEGDTYVNSSDVPWYSYSSTITSVSVVEAISPVSTRRWFNNFINVTSMDLKKLNTVNVVDMFAMFQDCSKLQTLDVSGFDTRNVRNMGYMFNYCEAVTMLDVSGFQTGNVENMRYMFNRCGKLVTLDVSGFDTRKTTDMRYMFNCCTSLIELDVSGWKTSNVVDMGSMFAGPDYGNPPMIIKKLDVANWDTSSCTDMSFMFYGCQGPGSIDVSRWDVSDVKDFEHMFAHSYLTIGDISNWTTSSAENLNGIFHTVQNTKLDVSKFYTKNVYAFTQMFQDCTKLTELVGLANFDTSNGLDFQEMFLNCSRLKELDLSSFNTRKARNGESVSANGGISATLRDMFAGMHCLEKVTLGANFSFNGDGTNTTAANVGVLPTPNSTYISGATGSWYRTDGVAFAPANIPSMTAATYVAKNPVKTTVTAESQTPAETTASTEQPIQATVPVESWQPAREPEETESQEEIPYAEEPPATTPPAGATTPAEEPGESTALPVTTLPAAPAETTSAGDSKEAE